MLRLHVRQRYVRVPQLVGYVIVGLIGYEAGLRNIVLVLLTAFGGPVVAVVVVLITAILFPPELEVNGDFRGVLYGNPDEPPANDAHDIGQKPGD